MTVPYMPTAPANPKRWPVAVVALATGLVLGAGGVLLGQQVLASTPTSSGNGLQNAHDKCHAGEVRDGGRTLTMGTTTTGGTGDSAQDIACTLNALGAPSSVGTKMGQTRALDGRLSATWPGYEASWVYDPDSGLDIIVTAA